MKAYQYRAPSHVRRRQYPPLAPPHALRQREGVRTSSDLAHARPDYGCSTSASSLSTPQQACGTPLHSARPPSHEGVVYTKGPAIRVSQRTRSRADRASRLITRSNIRLLPIRVPFSVPALSQISQKHPSTYRPRSPSSPALALSSRRLCLAHRRSQTRCLRSACVFFKRASPGPTARATHSRPGITDGLPFSSREGELGSLSPDSTSQIKRGSRRSADHLPVPASSRANRSARRVRQNQRYVNLKRAIHEPPGWPTLSRRSNAVNDELSAPSAARLLLTAWEDFTPCRHESPRGPSASTSSHHAAPAGLGNIGGNPQSHPSSARAPSRSVTGCF